MCSTAERRGGCKGNVGDQKKEDSSLEEPDDLKKAGGRNPHSSTTSPVTIFLVSFLSTNLSNKYLPHHTSSNSSSKKAEGCLVCRHERVKGPSPTEQHQPFYTNYVLMGDQSSQLYCIIFQTTKSVISRKALNSSTPQSRPQSVEASLIQKCG